MAVGRELLAHHSTDGFLASYDPCARRWQQHDDVPQELRRIAPLALDATHASLCCGPPDASGLLVDVTTAAPRTIPSMPRTPYPGRTHQVLADGLLVPTDKRFVSAGASWRVVTFDDATFEAAGRQASAWASGGAFVLAFGGSRFENGTTRLPPGGAVFDGRKDAWRMAASTGAPGPRVDAAAVWTGAQMLVYGGRGPAADGSLVALTDGGLYDPVSDRWTPLHGGPVLEGRVDATVAGHRVILWDAQRGAIYDLRKGTWRELGLPARVAIQDRPFGHGRVAVVTDAEAFVLDPESLAWARHELPKALHGRHQRVQVMTSTHLVVWAGQRNVGGGGCENVPRDQGCDPYVETKPAFDGAALELGSCR
ncbi:Kelch repeat-containing protein [Paraliomyxa miuraensis]|uniref:hypothetical protein n=1 Tax=Paraliomyxa miuraensis TaxID=376150 RepID=UPI0022584D6A|nr:hypothetical protein [Paraliomyxa miuraensis]